MKKNLCLTDGNIENVNETATKEAEPNNVGREFPEDSFLTGEDLSEEDDMEEIIENPDDGETDLMTAYYRDINKYNILTPEQEKELGRRILLGVNAEDCLREGDTSDNKELLTLIKDGKEAQKELVNANLRLVAKYAHRYDGSSLPLSDRIQEGNIGLMTAAAKFDVTKGFRFTTYATWWIKQAISRAITDKGRAIRLPVHLTESLVRINRVKNRLCGLNGYEPSAEEIAEELGMDAEKVREIMNLSCDTSSLDAPVNDESESRLGDILENTKCIKPEEMAVKSALIGEINSALDKLTEKERNVVKLRYGFYDNRIYTLEEVGDIYGVTRERVRQIELGAIAKIRRNAAAYSSLKDFLDDDLAS